MRFHCPRERDALGRGPGREGCERHTHAGCGLIALRSPREQSEQRVARPRRITDGKGQARYVEGATRLGERRDGWDRVPRGEQRLRPGRGHLAGGGGRKISE